MNPTNQVFLVTLAIIAVGYSVKKFGFITENEGKIISKLIMHTTFPALMVLSAVRIQFQSQLLFLPLFTIIFSSLMLSIAWFVFRKETNALRGLMVMATGGLNLGLFAFPIIEDIWGRDALVYAIMLDVGNTLVTFGFIYSIGQYFSPKNEGTIDFKAIFSKISRSMPLQGLVLGLLINISGLKLPMVAMDFLDVLAKANKPLGLLLMGIYLNFSLKKSEMWAISKVLMIRYGCALSVVAFLYFFMDPSVMQSIVIICIVLPVGLVLLPFSDELHYDSRLAGLLVNLSLVISFCLMWVLILGLKLA